MTHSNADKNDQTHQTHQNQNPTSHWQQYECQACGWIYDEQTSDPEHGIPAGTPFSAIPDTWGCPLCGVGKNEFSKLTATAQTTAQSSPQNDTPASGGVVVLGAGLAGWGVVDALRAKDPELPITLISADNADRYHKPMLSVAISQNKTPDTLVRATGTQAAEKANIQLLTQTTVLAIDSQNKRVRTTQGEIGYDKLVIATGASPALPKSLPADKVWHVNHLDRFAQLQAKLQSGSQRIAIVGAGMVGTEIAEDLTTAGHSVTLIDLNRTPMAEMLPAVATARIQAALENKGIQFLGEHLVTAVTPQADGSTTVQLQSCTTDNQTATTLNDAINNTLNVDHVIASTGLLVDERLPSSAGIDFERRTGIVAEPTTLRTSVADIYAIGDCMSIDGIPCRYVAPFRAQAATIADDILGAEHAGYQHKPPMIRLKTKAISVTATGVPRANGNWQIKSETDNELLLEQLDDAGNITATATLKTP